jgi:hypothetical protein
MLYRRTRSDVLTFCEPHPTPLPACRVAEPGKEMRLPRPALADEDNRFGARHVVALCQFCQLDR